MLQSFPKELEERYGKMKKVQLRYEELQERLNRERLEWKYDKNYLKQINERVSHLDPNITVINHCQLCCYTKYKSLQRNYACVVLLLK